MAEPEPGRGAGRPQGSGAGGVTASFKVDDSSLRKLRDLWADLVKQVKAFNAELARINPKAIDAASAAARGGAGRSGGGASTVSAGTFTSPPGRPAAAGGAVGGPAGYPLHPSFNAAPAAPAPAGRGGRGSGQPVTPAQWGVRALAAVGGGLVLYGRSHQDNMVNAERMAQMSSWADSTRSNQANERIRHSWDRLEGYTGTGDLLTGMGALQAAGGYGGSAEIRRGQGMYQSALYKGASQVATVMGSMEQGAGVASNLVQADTYWGLRQLGIQSVTRGQATSPAQIAKQFLRASFGGRDPSREEVARGMGPAGNLRQNMRAYNLDPAVQQWIEQYGLLGAKTAAAGGKPGEALTKVGGATDAAREATGSTVYDAQRHKAREQTQIEQEIADTALPTLRKSYNSMANFLDHGVMPSLHAFDDALGKAVGVMSGLGAGVAGPLAALNALGGGLLQMALITRLMSGTGAGRVGAGLLGRLGLGGGAAGARAFLGKAGIVGAGYLGGQALAAGADKAHAPETVQSMLRWGGAGAGIGFAVGGPVGAAVGGGIGAVFGGGKHLLFDRGGGNDGFHTGSREVVDSISSGAAVLSGASTRNQTTGAGNPVADSAVRGSAETTGGGGSATARGSRALAWMLSQSRNPSKSWLNLCLQDVRMSLGVGQKYPDATAAWYATKKRHTGTPPPGVPVWWTGGHGHVALSAGGGYAWSNDILRKGQIDKVPIELITKKWGKPYQGWSEDINDVDVYDGGSTAVTTPAPGTRGTPARGTLNPSEVFKLARQAGFDHQAAIVMTAIAGAESSWKPTNFNGNTRTGDQSYGLWQINMLGALGPERRKWLHLSDNKQLFDPRTNARAAWEISGHGRHFSPWSTFKRGEHRKFMNQAEAAAKAVPSYDSGAYRIENDHLALVHKDEMVLPAEPAKRVRDAVRRAKQSTGAPAERAPVRVELHMPIYLPAGTSSADAQKLVTHLVRRLESDHRLAAVMAGD